jgi:hypothetical protein
MRLKYSGGPNLRAKPAKGGAKKMSKKMVMVPAMKDPKAAIPEPLQLFPYEPSGNHQGRSRQRRLLQVY